MAVLTAVMFADWASKSGCILSLLSQRQARRCFSCVLVIYCCITKPPHNLVAWNNKQLLSHNLYGSDIWVTLSWWSLARGVLWTCSHDDSWGCNHLKTWLRGDNSLSSSLMWTSPNGWVMAWHLASPRMSDPWVSERVWTSERKRNQDGSWSLSIN